MLFGSVISTLLYDLWVQIAGGLLVVLILGVLALFFRRKRKPARDIITTKQQGGDASAQVAVIGDGSRIIDTVTGTAAVHSPGAVTIGTVASGAQVNIYTYQDGLPKTDNPVVRKAFNEGKQAYSDGEYEKAIQAFAHALEAEKDPKKRDALHLLSGNAALALRRHNEALELYAQAREEAKEASDEEGLGASLGSQGIVYLERPASSPDRRSEDLKKAVELFRQAQAIFTEDKYPVDFAMTQNNLGTAYTDLPAATAEERAENVRKAIVCYEAALEIYRKDRHPQDYCMTAANMGTALATLGDHKAACFWLREAWSMREFLPDQGQRIRTLMDEVCQD